MTMARSVVPFGTRDPEAAATAASGAGLRAFAATKTDLRIVIAMIRFGYLARHARIEPAKRRPRRVAPFARTAGLVSAVAAGALIAVGVTSAFFSATGAGNNSFATGTVTLSNTASSACSATNVAPGKTISNCTLTATYTGTVSAYLGLDVFIATKAAAVGNPLYNPTDATHALSVAISDGSTTYTMPTTATTCPSTGTFTATNGYTCYELDKELVSTATFSNAAARTFTTSASLPTGSAAAENPYQGGTAAVLLTVHATQAANQTLGTCTVGAACTSIQWS